MENLIFESAGIVNNETPENYFFRNSKVLVYIKNNFIYK